MGGMSFGKVTRQRSTESTEKYERKMFHKKNKHDKNMEKEQDMKLSNSDDGVRNSPNRRK